MIKASALALVSAGFMAAVAQVLVTRELMNVFFGDELCIGLALAAWLLWEAVGSFVAAVRRRERSLPTTVAHFAFLQAAVPVLLFAQICAIRYIPSLLAYLHDSMAKASGGEAGAWAFLSSLLPTAQGDIIGIIPMTLTTLLVTAPVAIALGWQFTVGVRVYAQARSAGEEAVGRSYVWDSVGHLSGGALLSCVFIYAVPPLTLTTAAGAAALLVSAILVERAGPRSRQIGPVIAGLPIVFAIAILSGVTTSARSRTVHARWQGRELIATRETPYGSLACTRQGSIRSFYSNGLLMFENPSRVTDEWTVHIPMLEVAEPSRVLLIGGGIGGGLREALKHKPRSIDYVELDPWQIEFAESLVTSEDAAALHDKPTVKVHYVDARLFVKRAVASGVTYDVIIVSLPDPFTAQLSRFYTAEFFREARLCLTRTGVLAFHMASSPNYLEGALLDYNACLFRTAAECFADVRVIPGDTATVLACPKRGQLTDDWLTLLERLNERGIQTDELAFRLQDQFQRNRIGYVTRQLRYAPPGRLNADLTPIAYYHRQAVATSWFHPGSRSVFASIRRLKLWHILVLPGAVFLLLCPFVRRRAAMRLYAPLAVGMAGMAGIMLEMALILAFESLYGYVYHKIGLLFGAFMVGLAFGGTWMAQHLAATKRPVRAMVRMQFAAVALAALLPPLLIPLSSAAQSAAVFLVVDIVFPLLLALVGLTVGALFAAAGEARKLTTAQVGSAAGILYSADLLGASAGALLATILLIPILGIPLTCVAAAAFSLAPALLLLIHMAVRRSA